MRGRTRHVKVIHHVRQVFRIHIGRVDECFFLRGADEGEFVAAGGDGEVFAVRGVGFGWLVRRVR